MQVGNESPDLQPSPDTEPAAGKEAEPTPSVPEAPDTTPGLRPDSASDDESGTADRQTDDTPATAGEDERPLSAVTAFADTPEELAARQATEAAAREAADRATTESGVGSRLEIVRFVPYLHRHVRGLDGGSGRFRSFPGGFCGMIVFCHSIVVLTVFE